MKPHCFTGLQGVTRLGMTLALAIFIAGALRTTADTCRGSAFVTRTQSGTARLHFEDTYSGYDPTFGAPAITQTGNTEWCCYFPVAQFTITQPVTDTGNSAQTGAPAGTPICHAEEIDLGPLADGVYSIAWFDHVSVFGSDAGMRASNPGSFGFRWTNGAMQCPTESQIGTFPTPVKGVAFDLTRTLLSRDYSLAKTVNVTGNIINVDEVHYYEGPPLVSPPPCTTYTLPMAPLPAGEYTIIWRMHFISLSMAPDEVLTSKVTVSDTSRRRSARH
jgi:hypothetical protein